MEATTLAVIHTVAVWLVAGLLALATQRTGGKQ